MKKDSTYWFNRLPEPYRSRALDNDKLYSLIENRGREYSDVIECIQKSFSWCFTSEYKYINENYWSELQGNLSGGKIKLNPPSENNSEINNYEIY